MTTNKTTLVKDLVNKRLHITRIFDAPVEKVWRAWTETALLDLWWAPKPWRAETKSMNFTPGGFWLYSMVGPAGERQYCRADYSSITKNKSFRYNDAFCDENGTPNSDIPGMDWHVEFIPDGNQTRVEVAISFQTVEGLETIMSMGFQEGFTMAHGNLDELLAK